MFIVALLGLIAVKTAEVIIKRTGPGTPVITPAGAEAALESLAAGMPWLGIVKLGLMGVGAALLIIYVCLRLVRIRPVGQEAQNRVSWTLGALVKGLIIAFFLVISLGILGPIALGILGMPLEAAVMMADAGAKILIVLALLFMLYFEYGARPADAGVTAKTPIRDVGYGFLTYLAVVPVFTIAALAWTWVGRSLGLEYQPQIVIKWLLESDSVLTLSLITFSVVLVAPVVEEIFFRGFTYPALRKRFGAKGAILISSVYFSLIHFDFFVFLPIMILGVALAFLYERRQSVVAPIALHFFHNAYAVGTVLLLRFLSP